MTTFSLWGIPRSVAGWTLCQSNVAPRSPGNGTRPGNRWLKGALGAAALSIARHLDTFLKIKYRRLARSRGKGRAVVATEHTLLTIVWTMLHTGEVYAEPGPDYYARRDPQRTKARALRQLESLGYAVTIRPKHAA